MRALWPNLGQLVAILGLLLVSAGACSAPPALAVSPVLPVDPATADRILAATVTIRIVTPYLDDNGQQIYSVIEDEVRPLNLINNGLGTVVTGGAGGLIITHDHWRRLDDPAANVFIVDAAGREIMLSITAFRDLIRYRDGTSMILGAPPGLPAGVSPGDGDPVPDGIRVELVHRDPATEELSVVPAIVEGRLDVQGSPSFVLRNLNGELIEPGNSGGGVWYEGRPIGVIHRTLLVTAGDEPVMLPQESGFPSHRSYAARLSATRMSWLNQGQPVAARP